MGELFIEGFDKYGPAGFNNSPLLATYMTQGEWTTTNFGSTGPAGLSYFAAQLTTGLSATGQALRLSSKNVSTPPYCTKTLGASYSRLLVGLRIATDLNFGSGLGNTPCALQFLDVATPQCSLIFNLDGTISLCTGDTNGSALSTSSVSVSAGATHYLEIDVVFSTAGAYSVYLDGVRIFNGTGVTKSTANFSANVIKLNGGNHNGSNTVVNSDFDDLYAFDTSGVVNNALLLDSPEIVTQFGTADIQQQWTFGAGVVLGGGAFQGVITTAAPGANVMVLRQVTPTVNCTLASVSVMPAATSPTAKFKAVLYPNNAGGAILGTGVEVVGCTSGTALVLTFPGPQPALSAGTTYNIGFITDTSVALGEADSGSTVSVSANTYGSGPPGTLPALTYNQPNYVLWGNVVGVGVDYLEVNNNPGLGDYSYVFSGTIGQEDLYSFPALSVPPNVIHTVCVKGNVRKTDSGARTFTLQTKSGVTDSSGSASSGFAPNTSYSWYGSFFSTDPNTGLAWTQLGLQSSSSGLKIAT